MKGILRIGSPLFLASVFFTVSSAVAEGTVFTFKLPQRAHYSIEAAPQPLIAGALSKGPSTLEAEPLGDSTPVAAFGDRIVLQLKAGVELSAVQSTPPLPVSRTVAPGIYILQAADAISAAREADRLAGLDTVLVAHPVVSQNASLNGAYAPRPRDSLYNLQWQLENRNGDGTRAGPDLNVRAAWPITQGAGVTVAVADSGIDFAHPELVGALSTGPHFNFARSISNAGPVSASPNAAHGTEVSGLIAAQENDFRMVGAAPAAKLASWVIFNTNFTLATDEHLMDLYQYQSNAVAVQNHSWNHVGDHQNAISLLEDIGISNAVTFGRQGKGSVMVRAAGNDRMFNDNSNDDGYTADPRVIAVGSIRLDGRTTTYSEPGACVLVATPSGDVDAGFPGLFSTDLVGAAGVSQISLFPPFEDLTNYVYNSLAFSGTSASAPQAAAVAALILSANTNLNYRDVQQILLLSSRHFDFADPDLSTNGAGLLVSHNDGFGVPDAAQAVRLAQRWVSRPALSNLTFIATNIAAIPDDGLKVLLTVPGQVTNQAIECSPSFGPHVETATAALAMADFGLGTSATGYNLTNKVALIERGSNSFDQKIILAAQAGAAFAILYNYATNTDPSGDQLVTMQQTEYTPIPAVFVGRNDGLLLKSLAQTNPLATARIQLASTNYTFHVTNTFLCEHIGLRVQTDHEFRGDVRITLVSPSGTRSVLQQLNQDDAPGPIDWTYYSVHHFFESSAGDWKAYISDEAPGATGAVYSVSLLVRGVPILDTDHDGLDDTWELARFGNLSNGPAGDPDKDGYANSVEQLLQSNPLVAELPFVLDLSFWSSSVVRLSWPASTNFDYTISYGTNPGALTNSLTVHGTFPETEYFSPFNGSRQFYRVRASSRP